MATATFWFLLGCVALLSLILALTSRLGLLSFFVKRLGKRKEVEELSDVATTNIRKKLNGPRALPVIGALHKLHHPGGPFEAFTQMAKEYGDIYEIQLGVSKCVIVSNFKMMKEVLITRGGDFGGRPDFLRFHQLFGGDRNNSLALCDWSDIQRKRRSIARSFCSPRGGTKQQNVLSGVAAEETSQFLDLLNSSKNAAILRGEQPIKPVIMGAIANMFTQYMCSVRFGYDDERFNRVVRIFDEIFWDINQGYAVDFLPWLDVFYTKHMEKLSNWAGYIRSFILKEIIEPRRESLDLTKMESKDFTEALLRHLEKEESELSWEHVLFELEDFLGGHSAVGNLLMMVLANVVSHLDVQIKIQNECDELLKNKEDGFNLVSLTDRDAMPYTEATIWETLRLSSSPIVPHVATCNSEIGGYSVEKDTVVFLNNYNLNFGEEYWGSDCRQFRPERFLKQVEHNGQITTKVVKPEYFLPFSTGKRTCIGQKLVQGFAFVLLTGLLSKFDIKAPLTDDVNKYIKPSCVAVPPDCFKLILTPRSITEDVRN